MMNHYFLGSLRTELHTLNNVLACSHFFKLITLVQQLCSCITAFRGTAFSCLACFKVMFLFSSSASCFILVSNTPLVSDPSCVFPVAVIVCPSLMTFTCV